MWAVAIGSNLSALWILVANSFMQEPVGFILRQGRAEMTDFFALLGNPHLWVQFPHVITSGMTTAAFFVLGISAYNLFREKGEVALFKRSFQWATIYGVIAVVLVILVGHSQAQHMVEAQPMKMAAAEALWETEDPASMSLLTIGNLAGTQEVWSIRVPGLLSFLAYNQLEGEVKGINELQLMYEAEYGPDNYVPNLPVSYWSFRIMVGAGFLMAVLAFYSLYRVMRRQIRRSKRLLKLLPLAIILPYLANSTGWILTEMGRQPWIVFGLQKTADAVSPNLGVGTVLFSLIAFTLVYAALIGADIFLLAKYARPVEPASEATAS
jgi:cytochrome d ubiquinol oxidase subunit I